MICSGTFNPSPISTLNCQSRAGDSRRELVLHAEVGGIEVAHAEVGGIEVAHVEVWRY